MTKKVGLIGCGAIGTVLAEAIERRLVVCDELVVFDVDAAKTQKLKAQLKFPVKIVAYAAFFICNLCYQKVLMYNLLLSY
jgi:predicted dinucleotide-utilizing enzyme